MMGISECLGSISRLRYSTTACQLLNRGSLLTSVVGREVLDWPFRAGEGGFVISSSRGVLRKKGGCNAQLRLQINKQSTHCRTWMIEFVFTAKIKLGNGVIQWLIQSSSMKHM